MILGLVFVELFKRASNESHFFSLHSWIGMTAIAMYVGQYVAGTHSCLHCQGLLENMPALGKNGRTMAEQDAS